MPNTRKECLLAVRGITTRQRLTVELSLRGGTVAIRNGVGPICRGDEIGCGKENRTLLKTGYEPARWPLPYPAIRNLVAKEGIEPTWELNPVRF